MKKGDLTTEHSRLLALLEEYKQESGQDVFLQGEDGRVIAATCEPAAFLLRAALAGQISSKELGRKAEELGETAMENRCLFLLKMEEQERSGGKDVISGLVEASGNGCAVEINPGLLAALLQMESQHPEEQKEMAESLLAMMEGEAGVTVRVAYGRGFTGWEQLPEAYREAEFALEAGRIFYRERQILAYSELLLAGFVMQLPSDLCQKYLRRLPQGFLGERLDEELAKTAAALLENRLNGAETARRLYIHRNTLTYRLDKIKKITGLDLRRFEDAAAYYLAMMIAGKENQR